MKSLRTVLVAAAALAAASFVHSAEPNLVSIFNGRDLSGWKLASGPNLWTVQNGVLVGTSNAKKEGSTLSTEKSYKNFILEFDVKYLPPADSGIFMRSPELQMQIGTSHSLRTELTGSFYMGQLGYPEHAVAKETWKHFKPGDWNTIRIQARNAIFTVWINGQLVIRYPNDQHPDAGPISVQVHNNMDMKVEFRNLRIAEI